MSLHEAITEVEDSLVAFHRTSRKAHGEEFSPALKAARKAGLLPDDLLTVGIVGGTGVGKSTLINTLAGEDITATSHRRPTTDKIIPYVHSDRAELLRQIDFIAPHLSHSVGIHDEDELRSLVLFDLPDMDSLEPQHARIVSEVLSGLDLVVWMTSITKYADRVFHDWIARHAAGLDVGNLLFVVNKTDDISPSDGSDAMQTLSMGFENEVRVSLERAHANTEAARFFYISALNACDGFTGLRDELLAERDQLERSRIRSSNRVKTLQENIRSMENALCLPKRREIIEGELTKLNDDLTSLAKNTLVLRDVEKGLSGGTARDELARAFFDARLRGWPLIRHVRFLLSPIARIGLLIEAASQAFRNDGSGETSDASESTALADGLARIQKTRRKRRSQRAEPKLTVAYTIRDRRFTDGLTSDLLLKGAEALRTRASAAVAELRGTDDRKSLSRSLLVYAPLLWFPFLQPLLEEILRPDATGASLGARLAYRLVRSAGAIHLIVSAAFVLLVYGVILLGLRAMAGRSARHECRHLLETESWRTRFADDASEMIAEDLHHEKGVLAIEEESIAMLRDGADEFEQALTVQKNVK